jgi:homeobox-leucine zipper protein
MKGHAEMGLFQDNFDPSMVAMRMRDDGYDQDAGDDQRPKKKKYRRHTPQQIQELEAYDFAYVYTYICSAYPTT